MAVCVECDWYVEPFKCNSPVSPLTDFIRGTKEYDNLNSNGDCKHFHVTSEFESNIRPTVGPIGNGGTLSLLSLFKKKKQ